jgi:hypothetical protein
MTGANQRNPQGANQRNPQLDKNVLVLVDTSWKLEAHGLIEKYDNFF